MLPAEAHESLHAMGGMVAAPHQLAAEAGREVLAEGGNAIEAMVAAAAAIAVVYPHMNHVGGDGFWLIREPSGRVRYIEACGFAGARATIPFYHELGLGAVPTRGPLAAVTVPGAVDGWRLALEAAAVHGGRMTLKRLLEPAVRHAREGVAVSRSQAALTAQKKAELEDAPGFAAAFLTADRAVPQAGTLQRQQRLADTLDHLARAGLADFYRGDVGREIGTDLERIGSPVTREDLKRYSAVERPPLSVDIGVGRLFNAPPPTQGLASLLILALFDRLKVKRGDSFEHVHGLIEATKRAFMVRDKVVCDYDHLTHDLTALLTPEAIAKRADGIEMGRALPWPQAKAGGDTVWLGAADKSGLVVSYIQSIFFEFGSGCVLPATGVLMQNRGASFSLEPGALNPLEPGRRPFHTLNPALAVLADGRVMAYGTMGGEGQPQTQSAVFSRHVLFGVPLGEAIARPRWLLGRTWGDVETRLRLEPRFDDEVVERLKLVGHDLALVPEAYSDTMGHAGAVVLHPGGRMEGAHDPRSDGGAAGV